MKEVWGNWAESLQIRKTEKLVLGSSHSEISSHFLINHTVLEREVIESRIPGAVTAGFGLFGTVPQKRAYSRYLWPLIVVHVPEILLSSCCANSPRDGAFRKWCRRF